MTDIINDEWITVHPNGKENKGRPLFVEEGESYAEAISRKYKNKISIKTESKEHPETNTIRKLLKSFPNSEVKGKLYEMAWGGGQKGKIARLILKEDFNEEVKQQFSQKTNEKREILKSLHNSYSDTYKETKKFNTSQEAANYAKENGVKVAKYDDFSPEISNTINEAIKTLPKEDRPEFITSFKELERKGDLSGDILKRAKKGYGLSWNINKVHKDDNGNYFDTNTAVFFNSKYKNLATIEKNKKEYNANNPTGKPWYFNTNGKATFFHEIGHQYEQKHNIDDEFKKLADKWANSSPYQNIKKIEYGRVKEGQGANYKEAFAEAWAGYHTKNPELPDDIKKYFDKRFKNITDSKDTMYATDKKDVDINGYVTYYNVPMTKVGVFPYLGKTISPELEPDKVYMVLRPEEELTKPETLESLKNIPFINEHTMLGKDFTPAEDKGIEGTTLDNVQVKLPLITNDLKAYTERVKNLIENQDKRDLSLGYRCRYELTPGIYNEQPYDAIQRDIRFNHIALVGEGRMGAECRVTDNSITYDKLDINNKEFKTMANEKFTIDEDLKEEIKEEIKQELLKDGEEKLEEKKKEVIEEPEVKVEDEDADKRKLIDEIGGILKGKVDDELIRTILKKAEELAYNPSETGANDECGKDEEEMKKPEEEKKEEGLSMDAAIKYIAKRDEIVGKIKPIIGDNINYSKMNIDEVVKYACDKLDIKPSLNGLEGYLAATAKQKQTFVSVAKDNAINYQKKNEALSEYLNGN